MNGEILRYGVTNTTSMQSVFVPNDADAPLDQLSQEVLEKVSHRTAALNKFTRYLTKHIDKLTLYWHNPNEKVDQSIYEDL